MTTQEWLIFGLALPATLGAIYCLRRRPEFGAIQKNDATKKRELTMDINRVLSQKSKNEKNPEG